MKLIVDTCALSKEHTQARLRAHLERSPRNFAVLTDFALGEMFNGANIARLQKSFRNLAMFPTQVVVLKTTTEICRLRPRSSGLHQRFIDEKETSYYRKLLCDLHSNSQFLQETISAKAIAAQQRFENLLNASENIRNDIAWQIEHLPPAALTALRRGDMNLTPDLLREFNRTVAMLTGLLFAKNGIKSLPETNDIPFSFPLRFALANCTLGLHWAIKGGLEAAGSKSLRNDVTDASYAAYASLFDGLITNDSKLEWVYRNMTSLYKELYPVRFPTKSAS